MTFDVILEGEGSYKQARGKETTLIITEQLLSWTHLIGTKLFVFFREVNHCPLFEGNLYVIASTRCPSLRGSSEHPLTEVPHSYTASYSFHMALCFKFL